MSYEAPRSETIMFVGGTGNMLGCGPMNGGGCTMAAWEASGSVADFMGDNGEAKTYSYTASYDLSSFRLTATGLGLGVVNGTIAFISWSGEYGGANGRYVINRVDDNTIVIVDTSTSELPSDDDSGISVYVGGAIGDDFGGGTGLQNAFDDPMNDATEFNRHIWINGDLEMNEGTITINDTIDCDTNSGSIFAKICVVGMNNDFSQPQLLKVTTNQTLPNGLLNLTEATFYDFSHIDFDSGGKDSDCAAYCVKVVQTSFYGAAVFRGCKFHGASQHGVYVSGKESSMLNCEFYLNGGCGLYVHTIGKDLKIECCNIHDNDSHGIHLYAQHLLFLNSISCNNGKDGFGHGLGVGNTSCAQCAVIGNVFYGNANSGIEMSSITFSWSIFNNTSCNNGTYGFDLPAKSCAAFSHNHAYGNGMAHAWEVSDSDWANYGQGCNITGEPYFMNIADGEKDFSPKPYSPLVGAGGDVLESGNSVIGALDTLHTVRNRGMFNLLTVLSQEYFEMLYYVYFSDDDGPVADLNPVWKGLATAEDGVDKTTAANTGSAISEVSAANAPGWYCFDITFGSSPWDAVTEDLVGVIDGGEELADAYRYKPVAVTLRGLGLARIAHKGSQSKADGEVEIFKTDGVSSEMKLEMVDANGVLTRLPKAVE